MAKRSIFQKQKESIGVKNIILQVGVVGSAGEEEYLMGWKPPKGLKKAAGKIGKLLGEKGATIITGGANGIMSAVAREAIKRDSITVGIYNTLNDRSFSKIYTVAFTSGMFEGGPAYLLPLCSDIIIAMSGGSGTLNELAVAYRNKVPVILLKGFGGWVDKIIPSLHEGRYLDERKRTPFYVAETAEEAVGLAFKHGLTRLKTIIKKSEEFYKKENKYRRGYRTIVRIKDV